MIVAALREYLASDAGVSTLAGQRLHENGQPQVGTPPGRAAQASIVLRLVSQVPITHLLGVTGLSEARIEVECRADTARGAAELSRAVRRATAGGAARLEEYSGAMGDVHIRRSRVEDERGDAYPPAHADDRRLHTRTLDVVLCYSETPCEV